MENEGKGGGTGKGTGKSMRKLCRNYPLAIDPLVSPQIVPTGGPEPDLSAPSPSDDLQSKSALRLEAPKGHPSKGHRWKRKILVKF